MLYKIKMAIKTFNIEEEAYEKFAKLCKQNGMSMSKQVEFFIKSQLEDNPKVREEYLQRLELIRKGKFIKYNSIDDLRKATSS
jgi:predicted CopG family antitoxin